MTDKNSFFLQREKTRLLFGLSLRGGHCRRPASTAFSFVGSRRDRQLFEPTVEVFLKTQKMTNTNQALRFSHKFSLHLEFATSTRRHFAFAARWHFVVWCIRQPLQHCSLATGWALRRGTRYSPPQNYTFLHNSTFPSKLGIPCVSGLCRTTIDCPAEPCTACPTTCCSTCGPTSRTCVSGSNFLRIHPSFLDLNNFMMGWTRKYLRNWKRAQKGRNIFHC